MLGAKAYPGHAGVTIRVGEVDIPVNEHILIIRAPGCQNERAYDGDLENNENETSGSMHKIDNGKL